MPRSRSRSPRRDRRSTSRERDRRRRDQRRRSRSRSPKRRRRSRSRSRSPRRRRSISPRRERIRSRSRSFSPRRARRRSRSHSPGGSGVDPYKDVKKKFIREKIDAETLETMTEEEQQMYKIMGFVNFDTTKGKRTQEATNVSESKILEKRKYRQYMNRRGGFNRPLDFIA